MSFDIFIIAFRHGQSTKFDRAIVERAFRSLIYRPTPGEWGLQLPDGHVTSASMCIDAASEIEGFSVGRPPSDPAFLNALFEVLQQTPTLLIWPDDAPCACVANPGVLAELPADILDMLCDPPIVSSGAEIGKCIGFVDYSELPPARRNEAAHDGNPEE